LFRGSIYQQLGASSGAPTVNGGSCTVSYERDFLQAKSKIKTTGDIQLALNFELGVLGFFYLFFFIRIEICKESQQQS